MIYLVFVLAVLTRFVTDPHVPFFTPVFGAVLFAGARLPKRDAIWFPVAVLTIMDWILTTQFFHMRVHWVDGLTMIAFGSMAAVGGLLRKRFSASRLLGCVIGGPTAYFAISNFGVWLGWHLYPQTWSGLLTCYIAALPFYRNSLGSTIVVAVLLFSIEHFSKRVSLSEQPEIIPVR